MEYDFVDIWFTLPLSASYSNKGVGGNTFVDYSLNTDMISLILVLNDLPFYTLYIEIPYEVYDITHLSPVMHMTNYSDENGHFCQIFSCQFLLHISS